ncbi:hypothetical protein BpHYR1_003886 [Brachionus plicatilis]|uniref:Uncharacterized protein n=1 Tax=Brachionus plicatilis TaxID=10195 RepID=A0A3M7Q624_BRAPC|nr:hypothetical protein BpHYR1_003886 [Brachionus plicatilis]
MFTNLGFLLANFFTSSMVLSRRLKSTLNQNKLDATFTIEKALYSLSIPITTFGAQLYSSCLEN